MADNISKTENIQMDDLQNQSIEENTQLPDAIKVGNRAYTQEELQDLVGLGEQARNLESQWNTKIDRLMPEYTKSRQQLSEYEKREQQRQSEEIATKQQQGQQLTAEEIKTEAVKQLRELMNAPELQQALRETYVQNRGAEKLIEDSEFVLSDYAEQGFEAAGNVTVDDLLNHMASTGIRNPDKALKDMLEPEYDAWKQEQLASLKPGGFVTTQGSTAGSKQPPQVPITKANLAQLVHEAISGEG